MEIQELKIHKHGFVRLVDTMGSDGDIADAARVSYGKGTRAVSDNRNLIRYLMRHKHTSPIEMASVKFHLKLPIFIMRQLIRHRTASVNEYSGRYSVMSDDFYVPEKDYVKPQSQTNKQGSDGDLADSWKDKYKQIIRDITLRTSIAYKALVDPGFGTLGLSRELSRIILPVSNYTECYWKIDLHNFFHFCRLRMDSHAQQEIRDYAVAMYELVKPHFPIATEAFEDYSLGSKSLSRMETEALGEYIRNGEFLKTPEQYGMSKREWKEFTEQWVDDAI